MSEPHYKSPSRQESRLGADAPAAVVPVSPATLARRRRVVRWTAFLTFVGAVGLCLLPTRDRGVAHSDKTLSGGAVVETYELTFRREYGFPFVAFHRELGAGELKLNVKVGAILGNTVVAFAASLMLATLIGRRRRDDWDVIARRRDD